MVKSCALWLIDMILGIGCDIADITRFQNNERLAKRILTDKEYLVYKEYRDQRKSEYLAGRFAAKEAIIKACPSKLVLSQVEILADDLGIPFCNHESYKIHISIAHEKTHAIAYAICEELNE